MTKPISINVRLDREDVIALVMCAANAIRYLRDRSKLLHLTPGQRQDLAVQLGQAKQFHAWGCMLARQYEIELLEQHQIDTAARPKPDLERPTMLRRERGDT